MRLLTNFDDTLRSISRRLRGVPRHSVQIALPKLQLAGYAVAPDLLHEASVVYSVGSDPAASFDRELVKRFGCTVHGFGADLYVGQSNGGAQKVSEPVVSRMLRRMRELGHEHVDLLRLDLEGREYAVIDALAETPVRPCQLVVGFHHHMPHVSVQQTERALTQLNEMGYRIFDCQASGYEYSLALV